MSQPEPCRHWWLLGDLIPGQARDKGTCRLCGAVKNFPGVFLDVRYTNLDRPDLPVQEKDIVGFVAERRRREA